MKWIVFNLLTFCFLNVSKAQIDTLNGDLLPHEILIVGDQGELIQVDAHELLTPLTNAVFDLNEVTAFDLMQSGLPRDISEQIIQHRMKTGYYISVLELQVVTGMNQQVFNVLKKLVRIGSSTHPLLGNGLSNGRHHLVFGCERDLETRSAYASMNDQPPSYAGSPYHSSLRYRYEATSGWRFGLSGESDAGEPSVVKNGFDFNSWHLYFPRLTNHIRSVALGDYHIRFGHGLTLGSGMRPFKSSQVFSPLAQRNGIKPFRSLMESGFMRGLATEIHFSHFDFTPFLSWVVSDALTNDSNDFVSGISASGLHRTPLEISKKGSFQTFVAGFNLSFNYNRVHLGTTFTRTAHSHRLVAGNTPYQQNEFNGNTMYHAGFDYTFNLRNLTCTGEITRSMNGYAMIHGMVFPADKKLDLVMLYRDYSMHFNQGLASAFASSSSLNDETGLYAGFVYKHTSALTFSAYADMWQNSWLKYRLNASAIQREWFAMLQWKKGKMTEIRLLYHLNHKMQNSGGDKLYEVQPLVDERLSMVGLFTINQQLQWIVRSELQHILATEMNYKPNKLSINLRAGTTLFQTSRSYMRESDFPMQTAMVGFYGEGARTWMMFSIQPIHAFTVRMKYTSTLFTDRETIGTGLTAINSNQLQTFSLQCSLNW